MLPGAEPAIPRVIDDAMAAFRLDPGSETSEDDGPQDSLSSPAIETTCYWIIDTAHPFLSTVCRPKSPKRPRAHLHRHQILVGKLVESTAHGVYPTSPSLGTNFPISYSETAPKGAVSPILSTICRPNSQSPTQASASLRAFASPTPESTNGVFVVGPADYARPR